jgi:hypothetical protein
VGPDVGATDPDLLGPEAPDEVRRIVSQQRRMDVDDRLGVERVGQADRAGD